jgi:hypothetical protein
MAATRHIAPADPLKKLITGEWVIDRTTAQQRRVIHHWATLLWFTVGLVTWIALRDALWLRGIHVAVRDLGHAPRRLGR